MGPMPVLLISANREEINMRTLPLGLACVAAATRKAGHEVALVDLMEEENPLESVRRAVEGLDPEAIGLSVRNIDDQKMEPARFLLDRTKEVVSLCRRLSPVPIVLGGAGYSIFPEQALDYLEADMGIQGEGEGTFPIRWNGFAGKMTLPVCPVSICGAKGSRAKGPLRPNWMPCPGGCLFLVSVRPGPQCLLGDRANPAGLPHGVHILLHGDYRGKAY